MSKKLLLLITILFSSTTILIGCKNDSSIKTLNYQSAITEDNENNLDEAIEEKKETVKNKTALEVVENSKKSDSNVKETTSTAPTNSNNKISNTTETSTTKATTETTPSTDANTTTDSSNANSESSHPTDNTSQNSSIHFKSRVGYTMDFPKTWEGKYTINETPECLTVIFKTDAPVSGCPWLFSISLVGTVDETVYDTIGDKRYITVGDSTYCIGGPTGTTLNENNPDFNTYLKMGRERYKVVNSIKVP